MKNQILLVLAVFFIGLVNISAQEGESVGVTGGGVLVKGWTGKIDAKEQAAGLTLNSAKLVKEGKGPARYDRPGDDLLEPEKQSERRLHR